MIEPSLQQYRDTYMGKLKKELTNFPIDDWRMLQDLLTRYSEALVEQATLDRANSDYVVGLTHAFEMLNSVMFSERNKHVSKTR
jgi:hypothetical protein